MPVGAAYSFRIPYFVSFWPFQYKLFQSCIIWYISKNLIMWFWIGIVNRSFYFRDSCTRTDSRRFIFARDPFFKPEFMCKLHVTDIFMAFSICETIILTNILKIKRSRIKDGLYSWSFTSSPVSRNRFTNIPLIVYLNIIYNSNIVSHLLVWIFKNWSSTIDRVSHIDVV